jgi:hypothetical protein
VAISSWDKVLSMNDKEKEKAFQARLKDWIALSRLRAFSGYEGD